jgi:hypothetical protein
MLYQVIAATQIAGDPGTDTDYLLAMWAMIVHRIESSYAFDIIGREMKNVSDSSDALGGNIALLFLRNMQSRQESGTRHRIASRERAHTFFGLF